MKPLRRVDEVAGWSLLHRPLVAVTGSLRRRPGVRGVVAPPMPPPRPV